MAIRNHYSTSPAYFEALSERLRKPSKPSNHHWEVGRTQCRYFGSDPCCHMSEDIPNCPFWDYIPPGCNTNCRSCNRLCPCKKYKGQSAYEAYLQVYGIIEGE